MADNYLKALSVCADQLLNIPSPVSATASSFYVSSTQVKFAPQLAIQADTSRVGSTCFISNKEPNPWFRLDFKEVTTIVNVRLVIREKPSDGLPRDFLLSGMVNLSVYVSNEPALGYDSKLRCGSPWKSDESSKRDILLDCRRDLKGQFLYVTVPSNSSTYLLICCIILNRKPGKSQCNEEVACLIKYLLVS